MCCTLIKINIIFIIAVLNVQLRPSDIHKIYNVLQWGDISPDHLEEALGTGRTQPGFFESRLYAILRSWLSSRPPNDEVYHTVAELDNALRRYGYHDVANRLRRRYERQEPRTSKITN